MADHLWAYGMEADRAGGLGCLDGRTGQQRVDQLLQNALLYILRWYVEF